MRAQSDNASAIVAVLKSFGFAGLNLKAEDFSRPDQIVQLGVAPNRIDLITSIAGVNFEDAWAHRVPGSIDGIPVFFIGHEDLIHNKESTGRPRDLGDVDELRKRLPKT